jgi:hypothetical protein
MYQLIFVSSASTDLTQVQFMDLALRARARNMELGITGVLAYKNRSFMQVIEGDEDRVKQLFASIEKDPRHTLISIVSEVEINSREYGGWAATFFDSSTQKYEYITF